MLNGDIHSTAQLAYVTLPILAIWLLGNRAAIWTASVCVGSALVFMCFDIAGVSFGGIIPVTPVAAWVSLVQAILVGGVPIADALQRFRGAMERVRTSQRRLAHAQRLAKVGGWKRELETNKSQWSDEMFRILGRPEEHPADLQSFLNYVHPDDREKVWNCLDELLSGTTPVSLEYRIVRPELLPDQSSLRGSGSPQWKHPHDD